MGRPADYHPRERAVTLPRVHLSELVENVGGGAHHPLSPPPVLLVGTAVGVGLSASISSADCCAAVDRLCSVANGVLPVTTSAVQKQPPHGWQDCSSGGTMMLVGDERGRRLGRLPALVAAAATTSRSSSHLHDKRGGEESATRCKPYGQPPKRRSTTTTYALLARRQPTPRSQSGRCAVCHRQMQIHSRPVIRPYLLFRSASFNPPGISCS